MIQIIQFLSTILYIVKAFRGDCKSEKFIEPEYKTEKSKLKRHEQARFNRIRENKARVDAYTNEQRNSDEIRDEKRMRGIVKTRLSYFGRLQEKAEIDRLRYALLDPENNKL